MTPSSTDLDRLTPEELRHELIQSRRQVEAKSAEFEESLEYQRAISEVLAVISRSPSDLRPVLDTINEIAERLCASDRAQIFIEREGRYYLAAHRNTSQAFLDYLAEHPFEPGTQNTTGRACQQGKTIHAPDVLADQTYDLSRPMGSPGGARLSVPLLRESHVIGVITVGRNEPRAFTERQIGLISTFASQAVIAIQNTRLFEEVQARTKELSESLEYQTALSEVLEVIAKSPDALQPVLDGIVNTAQRLCDTVSAAIVLKDGDVLKLRALHSPTPMRTEWPAGDRGLIVARTVQDGQTQHVRDLTALTDEFPKGRIDALRDGIRTLLAVPLMRDGRGIGALVVRRSEVQPFSQRQVALLETFANQAVIAINNVGLFEEVQARTSELQTRSNELAQSLDYQTAISSVLEVISRSKFDLQPVLQTLVENAARLCDASTGVIFRFDGKVFQWVADHGSTRAHRDFQQRNPIGPGPGSSIGRAALHGRTIHIPDALADPEFEHTEAAKIGNFRTLLGVPMLRDGTLLGVFSLQRHEVRPFTDKQIELVESFADQAVIAIENTRLFEEVQARNRDLTALGEVGRAVGSTLDLKVVLRTIVERAVHLSGTDAGSMFYYRAEVDRFELGETTGLDEETVARFRKLDISAREGGLGEAIAKRQPLQIPDLSQRPRELMRDAVLEAGFRASLIVPLLGAEGPVGALVLRRRQPGEFFAAVVSLMQAFADQSAIALENARLFEEIAQKSRELEIASQHKSQFVANMSHELRTPLAAILGFAELIQEGFYGPLPDKSMDALTRIRSNGKHLLGLINSVLDIAKIESGQFSLNLGEYALENVVETVRAATEALAETKKLGLKTEVADRLPIGVGDEQRLTQVLLNLVGNAIKFTDKGEVRISATAVNGQFMVSVTDTGPGIPLEEQKRVFEQFHQVDSSLTKAKGGTGLGLAIAKQIVEMHGGRIWVESTVGKGSTFQMEIPTAPPLCDQAL